MTNLFNLFKGTDKIIEAYKNLGEPELTKEVLLKLQKELKVSVLAIKLIIDVYKSRKKK